MRRSHHLDRSFQARRAAPYATTPAAPINGSTMAPEMPNTPDTNAPPKMPPNATPMMKSAVASLDFTADTSISVFPSRLRTPTTKGPPASFLHSMLSVQVLEPTVVTHDRADRAQDSISVPVLHLALHARRVVPGIRATGQLALEPFRSVRVGRGQLHEAGIDPSLLGDLPQLLQREPSPPTVGHEFGALLHLRGSGEDVADLLLAEPPFGFSRQANGFGRSMFAQVVPLRRLPRPFALSRPAPGGSA